MQFDEQEDALFIQDGEREWDAAVATSCAQPDHWEAGGGADTQHILPAHSLHPPHTRLPFVRILRDGKDPDRALTTAAGAANAGSLKIETVSPGDGKVGEISPGKKHANKRVREVWAVNSTAATAVVKAEDAVVAAKSSVTECKNESGRSLSTDDAKSDAAASGLLLGKATATVKATTAVVNGDSDEQQQSTVTTTKDSSCDSGNVSSENPSAKDEKNSTTEKDDVAKTSLAVEVEEKTSAVKTESDEEVAAEEDPVESLFRRTGLILRDAAAVRRRWAEPVLEEENYQPDQASLNLLTESQDAIGRRGVAVSTVMRNLSFVPGNEAILGRSLYGLHKFLALLPNLLDAIRYLIYYQSLFIHEP
jgi:hypothetical protein